MELYDRYVRFIFMYEKVNFSFISNGRLWWYE